MKKKIALSIAGSDPSCGAGIQADLKTFTMIGIHGATAITCITVQNTQKVKTIHKLPLEIIEQQIDTLYDDITPDVVKTGMLYDGEIIKLVTQKIKQYKMKVVVDPVMVATSGDLLSQKNFVEILKNELIPKAYIITPNIQEATELSKIKIRNINDAKKACKELQELGVKNILIKGGHLKSKYAEDLFFDGEKFSLFSLPRISDRYAHGSGCTLSALITGMLAQGEELVDAVKKSKNILWNMIKEGYIPGKGADVLDHSANMLMDIPPEFSTHDHFKTWYDLKTAVAKLVTFLTNEYIPEVGMNMGYALPNAKSHGDICAINGRIVKTKEKPCRCGSINFGVSKHIASIILTTIDFDSNLRSAMNIKYSKKNVERCKKAEYTIDSFDRSNEPSNTKSTMEWGTKKTITKLGFIPDIIFDVGGKGKEPMIRILGKNPQDVVNKIYTITKI